MSDADCPLERSRTILRRLSGRLRLVAWAPLPVLAASVALLHRFDPRWYANVVLLAILALFSAGQIAAFCQFLSLRRAVARTVAALAALERADDHPDAAAFRRALGQLPPGHVRDLVLNWLELGARAPEGRGIHLFENARERREIQEGKLVGFHVSLNRNIMKLGFLGTLVGLLLTFPPMRAAVMGLSDSGGEMRFISDIAKAIDEDAYAIQATLVSMGFSLFLEAMVLQALERLLVGFQLVDSHLSDWYLLRLRPWLSRRAEDDDQTESVDPAPASRRDPSSTRKAFVAEEKSRLEQSLREARRELERRGGDLAEFVSRHRAWLPAPDAPADAEGR